MPFKKHKFYETPKLTAKERGSIAHKIRFETAKSFHSMVKLGALANIIGAFLYLISISNANTFTTIFSWYCLLLTANLINVAWAMKFEGNNISYEEIMKCRKGLLYIVILIGILWGSTGVLFVSTQNEQIMTIIFLSAVLICFSFSTAIDFAMSVVSILCLLSPTIIYQSYLTLDNLTTNHHLNYLSLSISMAFVILGAFMMTTCYLGNKFIFEVFRLGFENDMLSKKLQAMNRSLDKRVKERTIELEQSVQLITYQATHNLLTELPNERLLHDQIQAAIERSIQNDHKFAIACFSLNGMRKINDGLGHQAANTVFQRIAKRFINAFETNKKYFISHSWQDVFVILIDPIHEGEEIEPYIEDLFLVLKDPMYIEKQQIKLTSSIGVSIFPHHGRTIDQLITNAEAARVTAAQAGGNCMRFYNTVINANASRQLAIESLLFQAVLKKELVLHYQPLVNLKTGMICGAEALVRWQNPELGFVPPLDFIPLAEANGMIIPIGEWVLHTACKQLKEWQKKVFIPFKLSVNLSAKQLEQKDFLASICSILDDTNLDPKCLELELTESEIFRNEAIPIVNKMTEMGISLAIDDFGTGYSEFSNLKLFNIDQIKIDKTFIQDLDVNVDSRNIVINTIALAKGMGINCLAEGVETKEQVDFLTEHGCYLMQGYYFSKPIPSKEFYDLLTNYVESNCKKKAQC